MENANKAYAEKNESSDGISLPDGKIVGSWNGDSILDLQKEIQRQIYISHLL